jgi:hypothetical protein
MTLLHRSVFAAELKTILHARIGELSHDLAYGAGVADYAAYRQAVGHIAGLLEAIELCDEAEKKADDRERGV